MKLHRHITALCMVAISCAAYASAGTSSESVADPSLNVSSSTSIEAGAPQTVASAPAPVVHYTNTRPFSAVAVAVKVGTAGIGFDVATPLARRFNLRGGASFFSYTNSTGFNVDGMDISGGFDLRTVNASVDYFPFGGSFHISPGLTLYNDNNFATTVSVPVTQTFTLNSVSYTATSSISGTLDVVLGNKVAPSLTVGFGNLLPRKGGHFSIPFEFGAEYVNTPTLNLNLNGTVCTATHSYCGSVNSGTAATDQKAEQSTLNNDLNALRFYPIVSIGVGYKF